MAHRRLSPIADLFRLAAQLVPTIQINCNILDYKLTYYNVIKSLLSNSCATLCASTFTAITKLIAHRCKLR